ncbi:MAG TPA: hypothetical protein VGP63_11505 [Planctomycetaceae bacterium]|jgi:hypothetical protein|nr:hypothetical protein [Planctomycetaceae bacterium]
MPGRMLRALVLGTMIFVAPCFATADTNPKKTPPKPVPQVPQSTAPSRSSKSHGATYHPHQGRGGAKNSKRSTTHRTS